MATSVESNINNLCVGVTILLVDSDSTSLIIISKMLRRFGYKVMTAKRAYDAFCILRHREYGIDLVLAEDCLPDMSKYELLETMRNMTRLPLILMSVDYDWKAMLGSLFKGAVLNLVKPIIMDDLKNLWQFAFIKEPGNVLIGEEISGIEEASSMESASGVGNMKRKRWDDEKYTADSAAPKKPKIIWTNELHAIFLKAIEVVGIEEAHPKKIHQLMNVPGLKKVNVSSHLQKYRQSLKRQEDEMKKKTMNTGSTLVHVASNHVLSEFDPREGFHHFSEMQTMSQQDMNGLAQENLNSSMTIPSPVSSYLLEHAVPDYPECNQTGGMVTNNGEFLQTGGMVTNNGQFLTDLLNNGDYDSSLTFGL